MDWNLKAASWHLSEFEREAIPDTIHNFDRSSSSGEHRTRGEFSIDLRLGQIGNPGDRTISKVKQSGIYKMESSPSGTAKRARGASNGAQVMCLVDGCNSDLSTCRDYHRRHKVCERHSKTPQVTIGGQKQRFCQQCSRFHSLEEFDEGKRSCRKRLDGHNRRRRKPPPDPLPRSGSFLSNYQGTQLLPYSSSHAYPSAAVVNPPWSAVINNEADARNYNIHRQMHLSDKQSFFLGSSTSSFKGGKHFPFLQSDNLTLQDQTSPGGSVCQPLLRSITLSESIGISSSHGMLCDSLTTQAGDSDCALSLLSSTQTQASGNHHMLQPSSAPLLQHIDSRQHHHTSATMDAVLVSNTRDAQVDFQGVLHFQSGNKAPHPLPFLWE